MQTNDDILEQTSDPRRPVSNKKLQSMTRSAVSVENADSGIGMVDGVFMVDGPSINHGQKAINHKSWLMGRLREWLMVGLNMGLDMVCVSDQSNPYRPDSEIRDG